MVKNYDPYLEKFLKEYQENPRSRVFAPLAESYRKSGLVDEALEICREGLEYHPNFISGMVAIARCYIDKELYTAAIKELEKVVSEVPDNYLAQKLLAQSYSLTGDKNNSLKAYKAVLFLNPKDEETAKIIREMEGVTPSIEAEKAEENIYIPPLPEEDVPNFSYINDVKIPDGIMEEPGLNFEEKRVHDIFRSIAEDASPEKILTDISTMTMGSLLEDQGLKDKALQIYKKLYEKNPGQKTLKERIHYLEKELGVTNVSNDELVKAEASENVDAFSDEFHDEMKQQIEERLIANSELIYKPEKDLLDDIFGDQWAATKKPAQPSETSNKLNKLESLLERVNNYRLAHH